MAWTAPRTWVTDEVVTSALLNTHIRDNELSLMHPYGSREYAEVSVASTSSETSLYTTPPVLTGGDLGSAGTFYVFHAGVAKDNHAAGTITLRFKLGATTITSWTLGTGGTDADEDFFILECWLEATGSEATQRLIAQLHTGENALTSPIGSLPRLTMDTAAVDLTTNQTWNITAQPSVSDAGLYIKSRLRKQYLARN